jgi:hypothetical protein
VAAKSIYTDTQSYATAEGAGLTAVEPALTYKAKGTASTGQNDVSAGRDDQRRPVGRGGALGLRYLLLDQGQRQHRDHVRLRSDLHRHGRARCGRDQLVAPNRG